jgi:hypothetical protein
MTAEEAAAVIQGFQSREESPRFRPDPFHLQTLAADIRRRFTIPDLDTGFAARLRAALVGGLRRLDALPRDDPFWEGSNRRPTLGKLPDFANHVLGHAPQEEWACWLLAACSLWWCGSDFGLPGWEGLRRLGRLEAAWPVHAACHVWRNAGYDPAPDLISFLNAAGLGLAARSALEGIAERGDDGVAAWCGGIVRGCPVTFDSRWHTRDAEQILSVAGSIADERRYNDLPVLADALEDAGCREPEILMHLRGGARHAKACWVLDLILSGGLTDREHEG